MQRGTAGRLSSGRTRFGRDAWESGLIATDPLAALADLDGVAEAVAAARDAVDSLRAHRAMRRQSETVSAESLRRGAVAAAALETGEVLSPTRDQELFGGGAEPGVAPSPVAAAVRGAGRAYGELGALAATWTRSPLQVLARLHLLAARDLVPADLLGRPRAAGVMAGPYGAALGPVQPAAVVAGRLDGVATVLRSTFAPALVVAAVVHGEIATLRPFVWGNQIVALAAQRLVLAERGLDPRSQAVVEVGHLELGDAYARALNAYATGSPDGVAQWVRHCGTAITAGALEGLAICESLGR